MNETTRYYVERASDLYHTPCAGVTLGGTEDRPTWHIELTPAGLLDFMRQHKRVIVNFADNMLEPFPMITIYDYWVE